MLLSILKRALRPRSAVCGRDEWAECYGRGLTELRRGAYDAALTEFRKALAMQDANADIHCAIGHCYRALGDEAAMQAAYDGALAANSDHFVTHQVLAQIALPGPTYRERLAELHDYLRPRTYLEIGVAQGATIALAAANTLAVGVDPEPRITVALGPNVQIARATSDDFFARSDIAAIFEGQAVELTFIDGMHNFEFALRDFIGAERLSTPQSTILVHDTYPLNRLTADRKQQTIFWSGDAWRMVMAIRKYRPELQVHTIAAFPTGLTVVRGLDPSSSVLSDQLEKIVDEFLAMDYEDLEGDKAQLLNRVPNDWQVIERLVNSGKA